METDYRNSHLGSAKANSYDRQFSDNPYRAMLWRLEQEVIESVLKRFALGSATHLDFACGTGRILRYVSTRVGHSTGIDVSEDMLEVARKNCPGCTLLVGDITSSDSPLDASDFELITAFRFFPNAQDDLRAAAMSALQLRLAPNGILVFNNHKNRSSVLYTVGRILRRFRQRDMSHPEISALLARSGLEILDTYHIGVIPASERFRFLPVGVLEPIERLLGRVRFLRSLATDVVYVCRSSRGAA